MQNLSHLLSWLSLVSYLLLFPLQVAGAVLCIGEDGHVEVELSAYTHCPETNPPHSPHTIESATPLLLCSGCGPCHDLSLSAESALTERSKEDGLALQHSQIHSVLPPALLYPQSSWINSRINSPPPESVDTQKTSHLQLLSTVILLI